MASKKHKKANSDMTAPRQLDPVPEQAFANRQLSLFQGFLANTDDEREALSNAVDLWDNVPRYSVPRSRMNAMRTPEGFLEALEVPFKYRGKELVAVIHPARIKDSKGERMSYYPSGREELIEHALRRIAAEQEGGFFDSAKHRSGARFSLWQLRQELVRQGHALRYDELVEGLDILSLASIEIQAVGKDGSAAFARSTYLGALTGVRRADYDKNREARWLAQFHPLVTQSIGQVAYRQFNYRRLMGCSTQLARWLLSQLVLKYTQAAMGVSFEMRYTTIKRDSALLDGYARERAAVAALDAAWEELKELGALMTIKKEDVRGPRRKLEEVIYTLHPSREFVAEQKAANRRLGDSQEGGNDQRAR